MMETELRTRPGSQAITYQDVASLARRFGVSYEAAVWRLKSQGYVGRGETTTLLSQKDTAYRYLRALGFDDPFENKEEPRDQELLGQLVRLAVEAFRQEEISRGRLMEIAKKLFPDPSVLDPSALVEFAMVVEPFVGRPRAGQPAKPPGAASLKGGETGTRHRARDRVWCRMRVLFDFTGR